MSEGIKAAPFRMIFLAAPSLSPPSFFYRLCSLASSSFIRCTSLRTNVIMTDWHAKLQSSQSLIKATMIPLNSLQKIYFPAYFLNNND